MLGWIGLGWIGLGGMRLGWAGLDWIEFWLGWHFSDIVFNLKFDPEIYMIKLIKSLITLSLSERSHKERGTLACGRAPSLQRKPLHPVGAVRSLTCCDRANRVVKLQG